MLIKMLSFIFNGSDWVVFIIPIDFQHGLINIIFYYAISSENSKKLLTFWSRMSVVVS